MARDVSLAADGRRRVFARPLSHFAPLRPLASHYRETIFFTPQTTLLRSIVLSAIGNWINYNLLGI